MAATNLGSSAFEQLAERFTALPEGQERFKLLLELGGSLPAAPGELRRLENRVQGCASQTWLALSLQPDGAVSVSGAKAAAWPDTGGGSFVEALSWLARSLL